MAINRNRNGRTFARATGTCARCGQAKELRARGLDATCYEAARRDGTLVDYGRRNIPRADLLEDYEFLRSSGETRKQALARIGVTDVALRMAQFHERKASAASSAVTR